MTLTQRSYIDPLEKLIRDEEFHQSLACKTCIHHSYVGSKAHRVCNKHDLLDNEMAICDDFRAKNPKAQLAELFSK